MNVLKFFQNLFNTDTKFRKKKKSKKLFGTFLQRIYLN